MAKKIDVAEIFGSDVFDDATMRERLPKKIYKELKQTIEHKYQVKLKKKKKDDDEKVVKKKKKKKHTKNLGKRNKKK